jgi:lipoprotein NlpI
MSSMESGWFRPRVRRALAAVLALFFFAAGGAGTALADASADLAAAQAARHRGDDDGAIRLLTRALARTGLRAPERADAYVDRAGIYERHNRYDAVISDMRHAIALQPRLAIAYYGLGLGYHLNHDPKRAIGVYSRGLAFATRSLIVAMLNGRGRAYHDTGDDLRARADFERAITLEPSYPFPYQNLGMLEYSELRYDAAFADFDRLVQLSPKNASAYKMRGAISFLRNQPEEARDDFSRAIALDPACVEAYHWRGMLNFVSREFPDAAADFASAARLRPTKPYDELWTYVARLKTKTADSAELRAAAARFDRRAWPAPIFALFLGEQTYSDVRALGEIAGPDATVVASHRCEAAFYGGELALSRDDVATARSLLDEALRICPVHDTEHDAVVAELRWLNAQPAPAAAEPQPH